MADGTYDAALQRTTAAHYRERLGQRSTVCQTHGEHRPTLTASLPPLHADRSFARLLLPRASSRLPLPPPPLTTHHPPPTTHHSRRLTTHDSRLTTHDSRRTTHHPRLKTHHSRLTTHHSPLTARRARLHSSSLLIVQQVAVDLVDETTTSELGRVMSITTKQFTTDKHHAASASRQHWCMWIEQQVAPDVQHTRQVAGKFMTSSSSSAAAGEKAARSTCEPTSSHTALRATGRARQPPSRTLAKLSL